MKFVLEGGGGESDDFKKWSNSKAEPCFECLRES